VILFRQLIDLCAQDQAPALERRTPAFKLLRLRRPKRFHLGLAQPLGNVGGGEKRRRPIEFGLTARFGGRTSRCCE